MSVLAADDDWQFKVEAYGWLPDIEATTPGGEDIEIPIEDILENLDATFMAVFMASKGKWSIVSDVLYLKISTDEGGTKLVSPGPGNHLIIPVKTDIDVTLKTWVVNLAAAYSIYQTDKHELHLVAGARYTWLEVEAELDTNIIPAGGILVDADDEVLDPIVGVRGKSELNDKWWLSYRFYYGEGDSDKTWDAAAQLGRKYDWGHLSLGFRYLYYDFDSDFKLLKDLDAYGPFIGAIWEF